VTPLSAFSATESNYATRPGLDPASFEHPNLPTTVQALSPQHVEIAHSAWAFRSAVSMTL
jgi:hypothetical protein